MIAMIIVVGIFSIVAYVATLHAQIARLRRSNEYMRKVLNLLWRGECTYTEHVDAMEECP